MPKPLSVERLHFDAFAAPGEAFHLARIRRRGRAPVRIHTHDFAEVFWLEAGSGLHEINGGRRRLEPGALALIRPRDRHGFQIADEAGFTMVNIAFPAATLSFLRRRYFAGVPAFFWTEDPLPFEVVLPAAKMTALGAAADRLASAGRTRLALESFLLPLLQSLSPDSGSAAPVAELPAPAWLRAALAKLAEPPNFTHGTHGLARLAGRCPEHVNRELRRHFGISATEADNRARLEHAARLLRVSGREIAEVALDCGFENLGHFYDCFGARFGTTPRVYRQRQHAVAF